MFTPVFFLDAKMSLSTKRSKDDQRYQSITEIFPRLNFQNQNCANSDYELKTLLWNFKEKHAAFEVRGCDSSTLPLLQNRHSGVSCCSRVSQQPQHHTPLERDVVIVQRPKKMMN